MLRSWNPSTLIVNDCNDRSCPFLHRLFNIHLLTLTLPLPPRGPGHGHTVYAIYTTLYLPIHDIRYTVYTLYLHFTYTIQYTLYSIHYTHYTLYILYYIYTVRFDHRGLPPSLSRSNPPNSHLSFLYSFLPFIQYPTLNTQYPILNNPVSSLQSPIHLFAVARQRPRARRAGANITSHITISPNVFFLFFFFLYYPLRLVRVNS